MSPPSLIDTHPNLAGTAPVALSYELFPPRSPAAAESLWTTIGELESTDPDYVSVTYGASGSNRDTAVELINRLVQETTLRPLAHLTCVGNSPQELAEIIGELLDVGVRGILALRGDQPKDGGVPPEGSLRYAQDLIELIRRVEQRRSALLCAGKVAVGVAAYPTRHPESPSEAHDVEVLLAKQRSGADFAITQVFFHTEQYADLLTRARRAGVTIPIIPGVMPLTSIRRLTRLGELTGVEPAPGTHRPARRRRYRRRTHPDRGRRHRGPGQRGPGRRRPRTAPLHLQRTHGRPGRAGQTRPGPSSTRQPAQWQPAQHATAPRPAAASSPANLTHQHLGLPMTEQNTLNPTPFPAASILGYPRIGRRRELKKAVEAYWAGKIDAAALDAAAKEIQLGTAKRLQGLGLTEAAAVPGTFSYYDQVLDAAAHLGAVPARFGNLLDADGQLDIDGYFTLARGNKDQQPLEMTKWFDTNYHYLVPEIGPETSFALTSNRIVEEFEYALANGVETRPYIVGPVTFLLLSKASDDAPAGFSPLSRLEDVLPVYTALLEKLAAAGAGWVQLDEPALVVDQDTPAGEIQAAVARSYEVLSAAAKRPQLFVSTPYGALNGQLGTLAATGIDALHLDVFKGEVPSAAALAALGNTTLVAGVVDGHNIWRNDLAASAAKIAELKKSVAKLAVSTSTSTQHVPHDVDEEVQLSAQLRSWLAFADQKATEVVTLAGLLDRPGSRAAGHR